MKKEDQVLRPVWVVEQDPVSDKSPPEIWFIKGQPGLVSIFFFFSIFPHDVSVLQPVFSCTPWGDIRPCVEGPGAVSCWLSCTLHEFSQFSRLLKGSVEILTWFGHCCQLHASDAEEIPFSYCLLAYPIGLGGDFGAEVSSAFRNSTLWLPVQCYAEAASLGLLIWICLCHVGPMSNAH